MVSDAKTNRHRTWPLSTGFRHRTAFAASCEDLPWRYRTKGFSMGRGTRRLFMGQSKTWLTLRRAANGRRIQAMPVASSCPNRIKASLSVFQRRKVKVLGFDVKARLRPQRMASRGCSDPFALVGAIGKACGEAWVCVFSGSPPGCWCVCPLVVVGVLVWLVCWWGLGVGWVGVLVVVRVLAVFVCWPCWRGSCVSRVYGLTSFMC